MLEPISFEGPEQDVQGAAAQAAPSVVPANIEIVQNLNGTVRFTYRGREYLIPHLAWEHGAALQAVYLRFKDMNGLPASVTMLDAYLTLTRDATRLMARCITRRGVPFWLYQLYARFFNPFRKATDREIGALLGFMLRLRMTSTVRFG